MEENKATDRTVYVLLSIMTTLAILKTIGIIDIPWSIVLMPVWLPFFVLVGMLIVMSVKSLMEVIKNDRL